MSNEKVLCKARIIREHSGEGNPFELSTRFGNVVIFAEAKYKPYTENPKLLKLVQSHLGETSIAGSRISVVQD